MQSRASWTRVRLYIGLLNLVFAICWGLMSDLIEHVLYLSVPSQKCKYNNPDQCTVGLKYCELYKFGLLKKTLRVENHNFEIACLTMMMMTTTTSMMQRFLTALLLLLTASRTDAYRVGDAIDTIARTDASAAQDVLRSQMPLFGRSSTAIFSPEHPGGRFSLSFEEGLRPIPWVGTVDPKGRGLERLDVTFVYSQSGDGAIYGISSNPTYSNLGGRGFTVKYTWVEEEEVNLKAGGAVMLIVVLVACVAMLLSACTSGDDPEKRDEQRGSGVSYGGAGGYAQAQSGVPKWD
jgi:hypothetical protein